MPESLRSTAVFLLSCCAVALGGCAGAPPPQDADSPAEVVADVDVDLRDHLDSSLRDEMLAAMQVEIPGLPGRLGTGGKASVVVADITDADSPRVAEFAGEQMVYAASLPKIAILFAAFVEIDRGVLVLDDSLRDLLTRMIRYSSNSAATTVYGMIGPERIAQILQSEPHRLYDPATGGGLWVGRDYGGHPWRRDPVSNLSHGASAMQVARLLHLLYTERLVSPESSRAMLEILGNPGIRHHFVRGLAEANPGAEVFRKSGTWKQFHADGAIVVDPGYRYIAVAILEDERGAATLEALIKLTDRVIAGHHARQAASGSASKDKLLAR